MTTESRNAVLEGNLSIAASKLPAVLQAMAQRHAESTKGELFNHAFCVSAFLLMYINARGRINIYIHTLNQ